MSTDCTHTNLYAVHPSDRCSFVKNFCGSDYTIVNFSSLAYCQLDERYYIIIPLFVFLFYSDTGFVLTDKIARIYIRWIHICCNR